MPFDFKKEYKEFYLPPSKPVLVTVPKANYIAVRGKGDPNEEGGAYQQAIGILYAVAYTLKMSYKTDHRIEGFYEYVVPPLEGFWWQEGIDGIDYSDKSTFCWISVDGKCPEGMCPSAWGSMREFVEALARGEGNFYDGWMKNPLSAMISCHDGFRPVSFYIEVI